jgi:hypothetical protein
VAGDGRWVAGRARRGLAAPVNGSGRPYANDRGSDGMPGGGAEPTHDAFEQLKRRESSRTFAEFYTLAYGLLLGHPTGYAVATRHTTL